MIQEWFDNNEALLKQTKLSNGKSMYDELYIEGTTLSKLETDDFTENQVFLEEYNSENPDEWN